MRTLLDRDASVGSGATVPSRGITGWITLGVKVNERGPVAEFGVPEMSDELSRALRDAAGAIAGDHPPDVPAAAESSRAPAMIDEHRPARAD